MRSNGTTLISFFMNEQDKSALKNQDGNFKQSSADKNENNVVFEGGTYSDEATTKADVENRNDMEHGDHSYTTQTYTEDLPKNAYQHSGDYVTPEANDNSMKKTNQNSSYKRPTNSSAEDDDDFDDTVGEDNLPDEDGFNANSDDPTESELTKSWIGNEKSVHEAESKGLEGEPMGGHNFGTSEQEMKNNRDASDDEHHSLGLGNSALNQPSEEISNPPEVENGEVNPPHKKVGGDINDPDQGSYYK